MDKDRMDDGISCGSFLLAFVTFAGVCEAFSVGFAMTYFFRKEGNDYGKEHSKGYDGRIPDEAGSTVLHPVVFRNAVPAVLQYDGYDYRGEVFRGNRLSVGWRYWFH